MTIICILGGGSVWTPDLVQQLARLPITDGLTVRLQGPTKTHLQQVATFAGQIVGDRIDITFTTDLEEAVCGARIIINQARVGGWAARLEDEALPVRLGFVGDESLGLGGLRAALRVRSFIAQVSSIISKCAPEAWLLNLSNPSDLVTRLWRHNGCRKVIGLCSDAQILMKKMAALAGTPWTANRFAFAGFSHIGWLTAPNNVELKTLLDQRPQLRPWVEKWNAIPTPWRIHLADPSLLLMSQRQNPGDRASKIQSLVDNLRQSLRQQDSKMYRVLLAQRAPVWYSEVVVPAIRGLLGGVPARLVVGLPNQGSLLVSDPDVQVESWAVLDRNGVYPEPPSANSECLADLRRLGETRSLAFAVLIDPNRQSIESYANSDVLVGDRFLRLDWPELLDFEINQIARSGVRNQ